MRGKNRDIRFRGLGGYTFVEIMIVVLILGIIAMIVIPRVAVSSDDARNSALETDLKSARRQIEIYKLQHNGRGPESNEFGAFDPGNLIARMTGATDPSGKVSPGGVLGPYLSEWPSNPFVDSDKAQTINSGADADPPRDDSSGWYVSSTTRKLHVNSAKGALDLD